MRAFISLLVTIFLFLGLPQTSLAYQAERQSSPIVMDGQFDDWAALSPLYSDPSGDAPAGTADFGQVWVTNDEQYLFFSFELGVEVLLQDANEICLFLDTDNNATTGLSIHGIGAELAWTFGQREGRFQLNDVSTIEQGVLGIVSAPTVSGTVFEVAIDRNALPDGQNPLFSNPSLRFVLEDIQSGDLLPDSIGGISYTFDDNTTLPEFDYIPLGKQDPADVRFLSYNVEFDALFDPSRQPAFIRILQATEPDIIGFQEILSHSAEETKAVIESALPLPQGESWFAARSGPDLVVVSKYPVLESFSIPGWNSGDSNAAFLLDMQSKWGTNLLLLVGHPPCCRNEDGRQRDIDAMMAFVRDAKAEGGELDLEPETPIIILGDMNLVGRKEQLNTLLTGTIVNTNQFGESFSPDWDGSALADLSPRHVALPMTFTWYRESSSFHPGRLDFIVYSDAVLQEGNNYVLFTPAMPSDTLEAYQLQLGDATLASDHLPVVGDFQYRALTGSHIEENNPKEGKRDWGIDQYPNPFVDQFTIGFDLPQPGTVTLTLYNALGQEVDTILDEALADGAHHIEWNGSGLSLPSGVYFLRMQTGYHLITKPVLLMAK